MTQLPPPAGWYPDPERPERQRYWDGIQWTEHVHGEQAAQAPAARAPQPAQPAPAAPAAQGQAAAPRARRRWMVWVPIAAVLVLGVAIAGIWGIGQLASGLRLGGAAGSGSVKLSEAEFYQRALTNLRDSMPVVTVPLEQPVLSLRVSPGYTAAARDLAEQVLAEVEAMGDTEFDTLDDAESYAYSVLGPDIAERTGGLALGGSGTELATRGFPQDPAILAIEAQIAAAPVTAGPDGDYWDAAVALAAMVGSEITTDETAAGCRETPDPEGTETLAFVCPGEDRGWNLITYTAAGMERVSDPGFVETMRHEIAHKLIFVQCGVSSAEWDAAYGEGVTNSYAVLYLGADREELARNAPAEYAMNETTDAKARAIHESDLACYDDDTLPAS